MYARKKIFTNLKRLIYSIKKVNFAHISENHENLIVKIKEENEVFPLVWLRDNCKCESCFHDNSTSRIINWNNLNVSPKVQSVQTVQDESVILQWEDQHISKFHIDWLKERSFRKDAREKYLIENYRPSKIPWNKKSVSSLIKKYDYHDVMINDNTLYDWLLDLASYGLVLSTNVPFDKHSAGRLAKRIAFIRKTHYEDQFEVKATPGTTNVAYLSGLLQLHTDLPYYEYIPGATVLHCLTQTESEGGESLLSDGLYTAEKLRKENKEAFDILSKVEVNWNDIGQEHGEKYHTIYRCPVIRLNLQGNVDKVYHSVPQRDSFFTVDLKYVKPWYEAMKTFVYSLNKEAYHFKLKSGELLAFDNTRLLHGRLAYKDTKNNQRHLMGCYIDWDEIYSKLRVLKPKK